MPRLENPLLARITTDPDVRFGKPCVRGRRITVQEILEWLSGGASQEQILADYPQLEDQDFLAACDYCTSVVEAAGLAGQSCVAAWKAFRSAGKCWGSKRLWW